MAPADEVNKKWYSYQWIGSEVVEIFVELTAGDNPKVFLHELGSFSPPKNWILLSSTIED